MKIFSTQQIREADQFTIKNEPISSIDLMERAATELSYWIVSHRPFCDSPIHIFCGPGNNGGDGLALARLLQNFGYSVTTYILKFTAQFSDDFSANYKTLKQTNTKIIELTADSELPKFDDEDLVVDAIFGSGLSRSPEGLPAKIIQHINKFSTQTIAVDIPSGLFADKHTENRENIVKADYTLSFQFPKLAFLLPENEQFVGNWEILDIELHPDYINKTATNQFYMTETDISAMLKHRRKFSHKGTYGHALIIAGGYGKMGAAVLSTQAALRSGVGLTHVHVPKWGATILQTTCPEAMLSMDRYEHYLSEVPILDGYTAVGVGPGIGTEEQTQKAIKLLIQEARLPLVMDADALNILALNKTWIPFLPKNTVLTPHPKEFERLVGSWINDFERIEKQKQMAVKYGIYVVLKGAHTSVAFPDGSVYFNSTGNPGMATGGSGDVLTGLITGLLAQGYSPGQATVIGVFIHGFAGDLAAKKQSKEALIASDLLHFLGRVFKKLT